MISAIILAGGASERMGRPKALLQDRGKTFLRHISEAIRQAGIDDIVLVVGAHADEIRSAIPWFSGKAVVNEQWKEGQLASLHAGISTFDRSAFDGFLVWPVDHPLVSAKTVQALVRRADENPGNIIIPTYKDRRGHPAIFPSAMIDALLHAPTSIGAKAVLHGHAELILHVPVDDEGVVIDIDTPGDYAMWVGIQSR